MAIFGGKRRNFDGIWRKTAEFGEKWRNLAKSGKIWQNIFEIKKLRNVAKFEKNDEVWRNLSMKWQNVADFGGISAEFDEI